MKSIRKNIAFCYLALSILYFSIWFSFFSARENSFPFIQKGFYEKITNTVSLFAVIIFFLGFVVWIIDEKHYKYKKNITYFTSLLLLLCSVFSISFVVYNSYIAINLFDPYLMNTSARMNVYLLVPSLFFVLLVKNSVLSLYKNENLNVLDESLIKDEKTPIRSFWQINRIFSCCIILYLVLVYLPISNTEYHFNTRDIVEMSIWITVISVLWFFPKIGRWLFLAGGTMMILPFTISILLHYQENEFIFELETINTFVMIFGFFMILLNLNFMLIKTKFS